MYCSILSSLIWVFACVGHYLNTYFTHNYSWSTCAKSCLNQLQEVEEDRLLIIGNNMRNCLILHLLELIIFWSHVLWVLMWTVPPFQLHLITLVMCHYIIIQVWIHISINHCAVLFPGLSLLFSQKGTSGDGDGSNTTLIVVIVVPVAIIVVVLVVVVGIILLVVRHYLWARAWSTGVVNFNSESPNSGEVSFFNLTPSLIYSPWLVVLKTHLRKTDQNEKGAAHMVHTFWSRIKTAQNPSHCFLEIFRVLSWMNVLLQCMAPNLQEDTREKTSAHQKQGNRRQIHHSLSLCRKEQPYEV